MVALLAGGIVGLPLVGKLAAVAWRRAEHPAYVPPACKIIPVPDPPAAATPATP